MSRHDNLLILNYTTTPACRRFHGTHARKNVSFRNRRRYRRAGKRKSPRNRAFCGALQERMLQPGFTPSGFSVPISPGSADRRGEYSRHLSRFLGAPVPECTRRLVFRSSGTEGPTTPAWFVCLQAPGLENLNFNRSPRPRQPPEPPKNAREIGVLRDDTNNNDDIA